jgi:hypothetical protein
MTNPPYHNNSPVFNDRAHRSQRLSELLDKLFDGHHEEKPKGGEKVNADSKE